MSKKRRWLWVVLFVSVALLLSILATGWNVVLVRDYQNILVLAKKLSQSADIIVPPAGLIIRMILGTLGFVAALAISILMFIKLLNEMRLNQQQSEFLATVSHELKTPIAAIELSSSLIRAGGITEIEEQRLWDSHQIELKRLREEVEALLEAARWQSRPPVHKKKPILLESWITHSFEQWTRLLGPNAILRREGEPLPVHALAELPTLHLIMDNLLSNARKFSKGCPYVIIRTQRILNAGPLSKSRWQVQVEDHGWGFNPHDSRKIFHRFFRSRNQAPYAIPGTGLGLYLAGAASRALGLSLRGESRGSGQGAIFFLEGPEHKI